MNKIIELFGLYCDEGADLTKVLQGQLCPYTHRKCMKTRKSAPQTAIGTCSVRYCEKEIVICPLRLLEGNQIFIDCFHLLAMYEPGNRLYVIPEIAIPGGNVDYFLVSAHNNSVKDFAGIELQTLDTTGTVWPERQRLLHEHNIDVLEADIRNKRGFGINWKMTAKTILLQMHHKAETFEAINKHLVLVVQQPFLEYVKREFAFNHISGARSGDPVHIHSYDFNQVGRRMSLSLSARLSTNSNGIAKSLGLQAQANIALEDITAALEKRLSEQYRLVCP